MQRISRDRPDLKGRPIVFTANEGRSERVVSCSQAARNLGIQVGMRTPDAESLAGTVRLALLQHRPDVDRRALVRLAIDCERFSPVVALEDATHSEALLLDVRGLAMHWGDTSDEGERNLLRAVDSWLLNKQLLGDTAIAGSASLALAVARYCDSIGTESADCFDFRVVRDTASVLDRLPVEALRTNDKVVQRLKSVGVDTVGLLVSLPRTALPARFGTELNWRLGQLLGEVDEPLGSAREQSAIEAEFQFDNALRDSDAIEAATSRLLQQIAKELLIRRRGALRVLILYALEGDVHRETSLVLRLFRPTASCGEMQELAGLHAESQRFFEAVTSIKVIVKSTAPLGTRQRLLFDEACQECTHELVSLVNRLACRVGHECVLRAEPRKSVDPTRTYTLSPATDTPAKRYELSDSKAIRLRQLPLYLASSAPHAHVEASSDGAPLKVDGTCVTRCWGPERIETGWWRGRGVRRDAYWVELENGPRLWLCRDLRSDRWRQAGEFI